MLACFFFPAKLVSTWLLYRVMIPTGVIFLISFLSCTWLTVSELSGHILALTIGSSPIC